MPEKEEEFDQELYDNLLQESYLNAAHEEAKRKSVIDIQHQAKLDAQDAEAESKTGEDEAENEESVSAVSGITPTSEHN